jgi:heme exporter protein D
MESLAQTGHLDDTMRSSRHLRHCSVLRRSSSVQLRMQEEANQAKKGNTMFLSVARTSTFALVTSMLCAYAWSLAIGLLSSGVTATLIQTAHESLESFKQDHQIFQGVLSEIRTETRIARADLEISRNTCRIGGPSFEDTVDPQFCMSCSEMDLDLYLD